MNMKLCALGVTIMVAMAVIAGCSTDNPAQGTTTGTISGKVTSELDGKPVSGVAISVQEAGDKIATTDSIGNYTISNVNPGSVHVIAVKTGFDNSSNVAVVEVGKTTTVNIFLILQLPAGKGRIIGRVYDADSVPVVGATIRTNPPTVTATSDAQGYYRIVSIDTTLYDVIATKPGFIPDTATGDIHATQTDDGVDLILRDSIARKGLIAYFPFNGDATDASGRGNNGTNSGATAVADRFGVTSGALAFNGSSSFVSVPSNVDMNLGGPTSEFTISFWAKFNGAQTDNAGLLSKATDDPGYLIQQGYEFYVYKGASGGYTIGAAFVGHNNVKLTLDGESNFWIDEGWHHVAITFSRIDKSLTRFTEGVSFGALTLNDDDIVQDFTNALPLNFGKDASGNYFFNGSIDDVRIYNRVLTEEEVSSITSMDGRSRLRISYAAAFGGDDDPV